MRIDKIKIINNLHRCYANITADDKYYNPFIWKHKFQGYQKEFIYEIKNQSYNFINILRFDENKYLFDWNVLLTNLNVHRNIFDCKKDNSKKEIMDLYNYLCAVLDKNKFNKKLDSQNTPIII